MKNRINPCLQRRNLISLGDKVVRRTIKGVFLLQLNIKTIRFLCFSLKDQIKIKF